VDDNGYYHIIGNYEGISMFHHSKTNFFNLLYDYEVAKFLEDHAIEVEDNEPDHYVELMMDNHKCTEWKGNQYYISDSLDLSEDEQKIYDVLAYALHV
jgi:hypothetical protein